MRDSRRVSCHAEFPIAERRPFRQERAAELYEGINRHSQLNR